MRPLHLLLALIAAIILLILCVKCDGPIIQAACIDEAETRLAEGGFDSWATVEGNGRDVTLIGEAPNEHARSEALAALADDAECIDVDRIADQTSVVPSVSPYSTVLTKNVDNTIAISGYAPTDTDEAWLVEGAGNAFGVDQTQETIQVAPGSTANWKPGVASVLAQIGGYDEATATLTDDTLIVQGRVSTADQRQTLESNIRTTLPEGITASFAVDVPAVATGVVDDYFTVYDFDGSAVTLDGYSPDIDSKQWLVGEASEHVGNANVTDSLEIAEGAPDGWRTAMGAVTSHVRNYTSATATVRGQSVSIDGNAASTPMRDLTQSTIAGQLPDGYSASFRIDTPTDEVTVVELSRQDVSCQVELNKMLSGEVVLFDFDSSEIKPAAEPLLRNVASVFGSCPEAAIDIIGRTDPRGTADYNLKLSQNRDNAVASYLQNAGVESARIKSVGYGETVPLTQDDLGMAQARRVEFVVTKR